MADITKDLILKYELLSYFKDEKIDMSTIASYLYDYLKNNMDFDEYKLAAALNLIKNKNSNHNQKFYDVSSDVSNICVKGITENKNAPILIFSDGVDNSPFLKIISSNKNENKNIVIETSNNPLLLSNLNNHQKSNGYSYLIRTNFDCDKNGNVVVTEKIYADSGNLNSDEVNLNLNSNLFLEFINNALNSNNQKLKGKFNAYQVEMLNTIYEGIKKVFCSDLDFDVADIIKILNAEIFSSYNISGVETSDSGVKKFSDVANGIVDGSFSKDTIVAVDNSGNLVNVNIDKNKVTLLIEIKDVNSSKNCKYMIYKTNQGFTLFRHSSDNKNVYDSFTLSFSGNVLNFSAMGRGSIPKEFTPINIALKFEPTGEFVFNCENKAVLSKINLEQQFKEEKSKI